MADGDAASTTPAEELPEWWPSAWAPMSTPDLGLLGFTAVRFMIVWCRCRCICLHSRGRCRGLSFVGHICGGEAVLGRVNKRGEIERAVNTEENQSDLPAPSRYHGGAFHDGSGDR